MTNLSFRDYKAIAGIFFGRKNRVWYQLRIVFPLKTQTSNENLLQYFGGSSSSKEEGHQAHQVPSFPLSLPPAVLPGTSENLLEGLRLGKEGHQSKLAPSKPIRPVPILPIPPSSKMAALDLNKATAALEPAEPWPLSLKLAAAAATMPSDDQQAAATTPHSSSTNSIISVA